VTRASSTDHADLYRKAARGAERARAGRRYGACIAIAQVGMNPSAFRDWFSPYADGGHGPAGIWWNFYDDGQAARILALCFMAAMVEAGDV
jgi:hypothetical protein